MYINGRNTEINENDESLIKGSATERFFGGETPQKVARSF